MLSSAGDQGIIKPSQSKLSQHLKQRRGALHVPPVIAARPGRSRVVVFSALNNISRCPYFSHCQTVDNNTMPDQPFRSFRPLQSFVRRSQTTHILRHQNCERVRRVELYACAIDFFTLTEQFTIVGRASKSAEKTIIYAYNTETSTDGLLCSKTLSCFIRQKLEILFRRAGSF